MLVGALTFRLLFDEQSPETSRDFLCRLRRYLGFAAASFDREEVGITTPARD
jgi:hypothetical protein